MAALPVIFQVIGTIASVVGAISQGRAQKNAADFNATVNMQNAQIAQERAAAEAKQHERETYLRLGAINANQGHAGGAAGEGSVLDVLGDVAGQRELERQDILYRGALAARGFTNTANLETSKGENAVTGSYFKAGSELLGGGYKTYQAYKGLTRT